MVRRSRMLFTAGLVAALSGCSMFDKQSGPTTAPPLQTVKNSAFTTESTDDSSKKTGPVSTTTMLTFADTWIDAVAKDPNKPTADRERLLAQSREVYSEILRKEPKNVDAMIGLGRMYHVSGEIEKVQEIEQKLRTQHPNNAKVWAWMAVRQGQAKQWDAAADSYHQAVKLDPDNRVYRTHLGFTLARAGRYEEGYAWLSRTMREADARFSLAQMMMHNGDTEQAKQHLAYALQVDPTFKSARDQLAALTADTAPQPLQSPDVRQVQFTLPRITNGNAPIPPEPAPVGVVPGLPRE